MRLLGLTSSLQGSPRRRRACMATPALTITFDPYGHLMPGNEEEAARLLNAYLRLSTRRAA